MAKAITRTQAVARALTLASGRGTLIFNDRLADGRRSLKVWGWTLQDYKLAKQMLEIMDCKVDMVEKDKFSTRGGRFYTMRRLHVTEKI
jgi:hypothetical protein